MGDDQGITRRELLAGAATAALAPALPGGVAPGKGARSMHAIDLSEVPNFCAHEHWGSLDAFGIAAEGFRADVERGCGPRRRVHLADLLLDPYLGGWIHQAGDNPNAVAQQAGASTMHELAERSPAEALRALRPALHRQQLTGAYQCLRRGILALHHGDIDRDDADAVAKLDAAIGKRYQSPWAWYRLAMRSAHFSELIRPVHPSYYFRTDNADEATKEAALARTVLRIDPLLDFWKTECDQCADLARHVGIDPIDAASWRGFLARLFDIAKAAGCVGIKQLQAYSRSLDFCHRSDAEVHFTGARDPEQVRAFQDWLVHACCAEADARGWPHQIHVGTHNLSQSSPLPLAELATRYPRMKVVLLHCWPFVDQAAWLAKMHANVYLDTCWLPVLNPAFQRDAFRTCLGFAPNHKLMCSQDSTSVEMAAGSSQIVREALAQELGAAGVATTDALRIARDILHNNAVRVYGIGREVGG